MDSATISASYATGPVAGGSVTGGLVGNLVAGAIEASWAAGPVAGAVAAASGGLTGANDVNDEVFEGETYTASYWDAGVSGRGASGGGLGKTTRELQSPSGYAGLYAAWNLDLDGDGSGDSPWNFGAGGQYPALAYGGLDPADQRTAWIRSGHRDAPVAGEPVVAGLADPAARASAGRYLRAFVYYEDASTGVWTRASTPSTARVAAAGPVGASGSAHPCALDTAACGIP